MLARCGAESRHKIGKAEADKRVERSLYERANGYSYDAVKIFMPAGAKNRDPEHWRDAWQLEHVTGKYVISDKPMTEEQWIKERGATVVDGEATEVIEDKRGEDEK